MSVQQAGREVDVAWRGRTVRAFVPTLLAERDLTFDAVTVARTAIAAAEIAHAAEALTEDYEALRACCCARKGSLPPISKASRRRSWT